MKFSDLSNQEKLLMFSRTHEHTKKLDAEALGSIESAINYLFVTNAGGAVAVLGFLGSKTKSDGQEGPLVALACFAIGLILVGVLKAYRLWYFRKRSGAWVNAVNDYYSGKIGFGELNTTFAQAVQDKTWPYVVGYLSFACLIIGAAIGFGLLGFVACVASPGG